MYISKLDILQVRNLQDVRIQCHPRANFIYGQNGSGKSSLLEALYLLGRGRSFRHRDLKVVINRQADELVVSGLAVANDGVQTRLGVRRTAAGEFQARCNGAAVHSSAELVAELPLQLIEPHSFDLLEGGPKQRRQFLDWGVFHVEHGYPVLWRSYQKALKQRNELLRRDRMSADLLLAWTTELALVGERLSDFRQQYLAQLATLVNQLMGRFIRVGEVQLAYSAGWDTDKPLLDALMEDRSRDTAGGRTHRGPHRADIRISVDRIPAAQMLSRGQTKLLVYALKLAQAQCYHQRSGDRCLFLVDDLPAELDVEHRELVVDCLNELGGQYFITGVERQDFSGICQKVEHQMFHVEQGCITSDQG